MRGFNDSLYSILNPKFCLNRKLLCKIVFKLLDSMQQPPHLINFGKAASLFNSLISSESFQWSEMAEYNYMLCLYALGDPDYNKIQDEINSSEEHSMKKRMAEFEKLISE